MKVVEILSDGSTAHPTRAAADGLLWERIGARALLVSFAQPHNQQPTVRLLQTRFSQF